MTKLLTLDEVGEITHRSVKGVREMIARKKFSVSKVSGKLYVEESELRKFLRLSRKITAAEAAAAKVTKRMASPSGMGDLGQAGRPQAAADLTKQFSSAEI